MKTHQLSGNFLISSLTQLVTAWEACQARLRGRGYRYIGGIFQERHYSEEEFSRGDIFQGMSPKFFLGFHPQTNRGGKKLNVALMLEAAKFEFT